MPNPRLPKPRFSYIWQCCACGCKEVNIMVTACPECGVPRCAYCQITKFQDYHGYHPRRRIRVICVPRPYPRAKRRLLTILVHGILVETCRADSGSGVNCIRRNFARSIGVVVTEKVTCFSLPVEQSYLKATGVASIICQFPSPPTMAQSVEFFVFDRLQCDVLLGRPFLRATQTLDLYQHRLRHIEGAPDVPLAVRSIEQVEEGIQCWLDGEPILALPDTGSEVNLISLTFARALGYDDGQGNLIDYENRIDLELADGSTVTTEGIIEVSVSFFSPKEGNSTIYELVKSSNEEAIANEKSNIQRDSQIRETFYILAGLRYKAILGEPLLVTARSIEQVEEGIQCWLDGEPILALPDTGADVNLISSTFARALGYRALGCRALYYSDGKGISIDYENRIEFEVADGSTRTTEGIIQLSVSFFSPEESNSTVYELVDNKEATVDEKTDIQRNSQIRETFHVVAGLRYKAILGETLLATFDVYNQRTTKFGPLLGRECAGIAIFRRKKTGEGKTGSTRPLSPEQKFMDEFSLEYDRHLKEKEDIEERERQGSISDELAQVKILQADQEHLQWLRSFRGLLDSYYPGYYERNVPQEIA